MKLKIVRQYFIKKFFFFSVLHCQFAGTFSREIVFRLSIFCDFWNSILGEFIGIKVYCIGVTIDDMGKSTFGRRFLQEK
jgi:hypothetical protein